MCAIAGLITDCEEINNFQAIKNMADSMRHRGPDSQGFAFTNFSSSKVVPLSIDSLNSEGGCFFGFDRLSIQDLSIAGSQPMISDESSVAILFNGEIYNTAYLRDIIEDKNYRGHSDTEVILKLYLQYGLHKAIRLLNGMFAIAIVDTRKGNVYLVRDRVGIKPLYYTCVSNSRDKTFLFASEMKAFLQYPTFHGEIDQEALHEFFTFGDALTPLLKGVCEVDPGTIITVNYKTINVRVEKWYNLNDYQRPEHIEKSLEQIDTEFSSILSDSVNRQLIGDVKMGCQLSGGVDSSLVTYFAHRNETNVLNDSVSIIPSDDEFTEQKYIEFLAKESGIEAHEFSLEGDFVEKNLDRCVWHYESIITYHNVVALILLSQQAKQYVTVLLSGEGADELFGGYTWFEDGVFASEYLKIKNGLLAPNDWAWLNEKIRGLNGARTFGDFAISCTDNISPDIAKKLLGGCYSRSGIYLRRLEYFESFSGTDFDKHIKYEISTRMKNLLMRQDKTSMANSIENRVPFLDNEVIIMV